MDQMYRRNIGINTAKAEVGQHVFSFGAPCTSCRRMSVWRASQADAVSPATPAVAQARAHQRLR
jgi:hypothetical protein